jgi:hypothetical protein
MRNYILMDPLYVMITVPALQYDDHRREDIPRQHPLQ